ncbi:MAG TPA: N-acetylneuraminate synthase family protein [Opitutaceae bacterium]|nr:N-acetylneuraminate synthase family protein [Opitutaceae bacterium]
MPPLFILEMANNHMGNVAHGIRIIREMREACAGFDFRFAVKLQYRDLPALIHPDYRSRQDLKFVQRFSETALGWDNLRRLRDAIAENGFLAVCTPSDEASVDKVVEHGFDYLKVASCALTDWPLAEKIATTRLPVILSTAGEALEDIDRIVAFYRHRERDISILHCVGEYPTAARDLQLNQIDLLRHRYAGIEIGYSTHEDPAQFDAVRMAAAKGATIFEKHVGVPTESHPLNLYSANPAQVRRWLEAAAEAMAMAGKTDGRHPISEKERATLGELRRGVFARRPIAEGAVLAGDDVFFALPSTPGQLVANDWSKYMEFRAGRAFAAGERIGRSQVAAADTRSVVHGIVRDVKALLKTSRTIVPAQLDLELSHHYGIERFREVGSAMITVINREYCKRLVLLLPGQRHPEHWHTVKDETFHLLYGEIELVLCGERRRCATNDVVVIPCGARHEFWSENGAVIEEISSTHTRNDSGYADESITRSPSRKTYLTNWMD